MFIDAVVGLGVIAMVGAVLTASLIQVGRGRDRLEEFRTAGRLLESAGAEVASGRAVPDGVKATDLAGPDGSRWVRLSIDRPPATTGERRASRLTLIVPDGRTPPTTGGAPR